MIGAGIIGAVFASITYLWFLALIAPVGYEDEDGFHIMEDEENE